MPFTSRADFVHCRQHLTIVKNRFFFFLRLASTQEFCFNSFRVVSNSSVSCFRSSALKVLHCLCKYSLFMKVYNYIQKCMLKGNKYDMAEQFRWLPES